MSHQNNIDRILTVYHALGELRDQVVFVGGSTLSLYTDVTGLSIRPTNDVDLIVEIVSYKDRTALDEKLRALGFKNDVMSGIVCRYKVNNVIADIMTTEDTASGFSNRWYPSGHRKAVDIQVDATTSIKILSAPYFIATKLEAFKGRGQGDGRTSHDFEDIVFIFENRSHIWEELSQADHEVKKYLQEEFTLLLKNIHFREWIEAHVERGSLPATGIIISELEKFCGNNDA